MNRNVFSKISKIVLLTSIIFVVLISAYGSNVFWDAGEAAKKKTGNLFVNSTPTKANLYVDDLFKGLTPIRIKGLIVGTHKVKVSKSDYQDYVNEAVPIFTGKTTKLSIKLIPANFTQQNQTGNLSVNSTPANANLFVDNIFRGLTPIIVKGLSVGKHDVAVNKTGYNSYFNTTFIEAGKTISLFITLTLVNQTKANQTKYELLYEI